MRTKDAGDGPPALHWRKCPPQKAAVTTKGNLLDASRFPLGFAGKTGWVMSWLP
jgi:hypothetical protein